MCDLLGQGLPLHVAESELFPVQRFPPNCGSGFEHVLSRFFIPPPQETLHLFQVDHPSQSPST